MSFAQNLVAASRTSPVNAKLAGDEIQVVFSATGEVATGNTVIPHDNTVPQVTEGTQFMSASITPTSATSILEIEILAHISHNSGSGQFIVGALFRDGASNALAACSVEASAYGSLSEIKLKHRVVAGSTASTTFTFRAGPGASAVVTFNGTGAVRALGGVMGSYISVREIKA